MYLTKVEQMSCRWNKYYIRFVPWNKYYSIIFFFWNKYMVTTSHTSRLNYAADSKLRENLSKNMFLFIYRTRKVERHL